MPSLNVRLIVWEGPESDERHEQERIKRWHKNLKFAITETIKGTEWRYHRWKKHRSNTTETYKFEIYLVHPEIPSSQQTNVKLHELCTRLLSSSLNVQLQLLDIIDSFTFNPSQEGIVNTTDETFARYFSIAIVETYCLGDTLSQELEMMRENFLSRNTTKYLHHPMVGIYNAADISDRFSDHIDKMTNAVEMLNGGSVAELAGAGVKVAKAGVKTVRSKSAAVTPDISKTQAQNKLALKLYIASAVLLIRAFKAFAPQIKEKLKPQLEILNTRVLEGRLYLASEAYLTASTGPIAALNRLYSLDSPSVDDLAITINTFGNLMQTALPLFSLTLVVSDAEFATISTLSMAAGAGLTTSIGAGGYILSAGAVTAGPAGLLAVGGICTVAFGIAAIVEGIKWGQRQKTNPSILLLAIQKTLEECSRYLLGLLFMAADEGGGEDHSHLDRVQALRDQLSSDDFAKPGYMKAYYKNITKKLEKDMRDLRIGLERYRNELKAKNGTESTSAA